MLRTSYTENTLFWVHAHFVISLTSIVDLKPDTNSPPPTDSQVAPLEQFVPTRTYQLVVLRPLVYVHAASHSSEGSTAVREHHSKRKKVRFSRRFKNIFLQYQWLVLFLLSLSVLQLNTSLIFCC